MTTKTRTNHKEFFALLNEVGIEDRKVFLESYTGGVTNSLTELACVYPMTYDEMLNDLRLMKRQAWATEDKWRKRLMAAIWAWAEAVDLEGKSDKWVKAVACRAAEVDDFNKIPLGRLRSLYNAFIKMKQDIVRVGELTRDALAEIEWSMTN